MDPRAGQLREFDVAQNHLFFCVRRLGGDAEARRNRALVHVATLGERLVLTVLRDDHAEVGGVLEGAPHHTRVLHSAPVVGEHPHSERGHFGERSKPLAVASDGDRTGDGDLAARVRGE